MRRHFTAIVLTVSSIAAAILPARAADWPVFGFDSARSGFNRAETILTPANVSGLRARWRMSFGVTADSTPILIENVSAGGATHPMLFQTNKSGTTFGIEAKTGRIVWHFGTSGPGITTSTPAADPSGQAIYAPGIDGFVHKLDAATGRELRAPGFPARVTRMPRTEKDASSLNVANGFLYATTSGYNGDAPPYDGHVVAVRLNNGAAGVFNSLCSNLRVLPAPNSCADSDSGIWGRGGAVVDPDPAMNGQIFATTGNGDYDADKGGHNYGDSVLGLSADLSRLVSHYTPSDFDRLENQDIDMGSTSPALLPRVAGSRTPLMLVQGGKDGILRLVNRAPLPGIGRELQEIQVSSEVFSTPAVWTDGAGRTWVFLGMSQEVDAFRLETGGGGVSRLAAMWRSRAGQSGEGTSPVVANGIVFVATDGALLALDAHTGRTLWSSAQNGAGPSIGPVHWESPIVVNGWVYCSDERGNLTAYALPRKSADAL